LGARAHDWKPENMTLTPRRALVTGSTRGIGLAVVRRLAREGHSVVAVYSGDDAPGEEAAQELRGARLEVRFEQVDLGQSEQVLALFSRLADEGRSPELLVTAARLTRVAPLGLLADRTFDEVLNASLRTTVLTCQQAVKAMTRFRFGRIVNLTSPATSPGQEAQTADAPAELAVLGYTRALAREVARFGITANAVSPGLIRTEMTTPPEDPQLEARIRRAPVRRAGTTDEVAGLVNMLCGDDAGYITGQCLSIDRGLS
jgi:3-oxoacyl-[acyl-carrier protein] reductase